MCVSTAFEKNEDACYAICATEQFIDHDGISCYNCADVLHYFERHMCIQECPTDEFITSDGLHCTNSYEDNE